jgi:hypothetical protein
MKPIAVMDTENYPNFWLCKFKNIATGKTKEYALHEGHPLDIAGLKDILLKYTIITFNGINYDFPMIAYALSGATNKQLKEANDKIIVGGLKAWQFYDQFHLKPFAFIDDPRFDQIDLIEVAPGVADSLKIYGGRMHTKKMQDLPFNPAEPLSPEQMILVSEYCGNDLQVTSELYAELKKPIDLRVKMSKQYGMDLRSKSDAQLSETVICSEIEKLMDCPVKKHNIKVGDTFKYKVPDFISFKTPYMQSVLARFAASEFVVNIKHKVEPLYDYLDEPIVINGTEYQFGMGGLHSKECNFSCHSDVDTQLFDIDATSFYPYVILVCGLFPPQLGEAFLEIFKKIVETRITAKKSGNEDTAQSMKIMINGVFGKLGSWFSKLFSPSLMIQTTLTGQLVALMLIERLELAGIHIVSANTDGITVSCPRNFIDLKNSIVREWMVDTGFAIEENKYVAVYSQSVNSYIAVKPDGKSKRKGEFGKVTLQHTPKNEIIGDAICEYLINDIPVEETIRNCTDIRKFVTVRKVNGGAVKDDSYIGKAIRYYHSTATETAIHYQTTGNMVPESMGAVPVMQLPDEFPKDVDLNWYIEQTHAAMFTPGYLNADKKDSGIGLGRFMQPIDECHANF